MLHLLSEEALRNPYPLYDQIRSTSPLLHEPLANAWMVFDYDTVKRVLSDHESFSSSTAAAGRPHPPWLIFLDPPRHKQLRALVNQAFTPRSVANLESRIRDLSRDLLDRAVGHGRMDLVADYAVPLPLMVIAEMLGLPAADWPLYKRWSDVILLLSHTISGTPDAAARAGQEYLAVTAEMNDYVATLLADRRTTPRDDLLTRLDRAEVDGQRLTPPEILGFFQLLLLAGHETTTNLISNTILTLLDHPDHLARLRATPGLVPQAIEEVLRYRSPVQAAFRATRQPVTLHGQALPAGQFVIAMIGSANRDPRAFPDPGRFDPARDPNPHVAFGHGTHFCLGAPLARLEARVAIPDLLTRLPGLSLAADTPWKPRNAFHVHGPSHLPVQFQPSAHPPEPPPHHTST